MTTAVHTMISIDFRICFKFSKYYSGLVIGKHGAVLTLYAAVHLGPCKPHPLIFWTENRHTHYSWPAERLHQCWFFYAIFRPRSPYSRTHGRTGRRARHV